MSNNDIVVNVWIDSEEVQRGVLRVNEDDVLIVLKSRKVISGKSSTNIFYSLVDDSMHSRFKIIFNPVLVKTHFYAADIGQVAEDIFPPSSDGFYGRLRAGKDKAVFIIQNILNDTRRWLIIGDSQTGKIFETHTIQPYEAEALKLFDDQEITDLWDREVWADKEELLKKEIADILDEPSLSWEMISKLVGEVPITELERGETVRETFSQLVPNSFPEPIRDQLMAFLASIMMDKIKMDDLINQSSTIYASPMFGILMRGHFRCKVDKVKWSPYLEIIQQFSRGQLEQPSRTPSELIDSSWRLLWAKMVATFPNWFGNAIVSARELNKSNKFHPRLPVTISQARRSRKLWKKRLAAMTYGLQVRGHVNPHVIGLTELVYIGAAYRWPHRHMRFITRLGLVSENPPHLQVLTVPPSSVERVMRALPQSIKISWSTRVVNLNLYNDASERWEIPIEKILESVHNQSSKKKVKKHFDDFSSADSYQITPNDAKVLGLVSRFIHLEDFERSDYFRYWKLGRREVSSIVSKLHRKGVLKLTYEVDDSRLVSLATIVQGKSERVSSFIHSLLTYTPTSLVMLNDEFDRGVVLSRFPEDLIFDLVSKLNEVGMQHNIVIRCLRPRAFRSFTYTLYHRLLRENGTWDDDVSAFLSQARSKRRELSESNA
ncbi:MAG: hypothetical protein ACFFEE_00820 [Candidatus Thorarchaeota archaeon]